MSLARGLLFVCAAYLALASLDSLAALAAVGSVAPNLWAVAAACVCASSRFEHRPWIALAIGLACDLAGLDRLGLDAVLYLVVGSLALQVAGYLPRGFLVQASTASALAGLLAVASLLLHWFSGYLDAGFAATVGRACMIGVYSALLCWPVAFVIGSWRDLGRSSRMAYHS